MSSDDWKGRRPYGTPVLVNGATFPTLKRGANERCAYGATGVEVPRLRRQMTESEIQCLKDNIDKIVAIKTTDGERLTAKVISVFHDSEYDEHELFYELVSTNMLESYRHLGDAGGYALDFGKIISVKPVTEASSS